MGYIKFDRNQANEGNSLLLPLENIITVKSASATAVELKYGIITHPVAETSGPECLTHELTVEAKAGFTLTRDSIVDAVILAIENAGLTGKNVAVAGMNVTAQTIKGEVF